MDNLPKEVEKELEDSVPVDQQHDEEIVELDPPLKEMREIARVQKQREDVLNIMLKKSEAYRKLQRDRLEHARLAEENARRAKENELKEEQAFYDAGNEFYDMLCNTFYLRRNTEESSCNPNFIVGNQPSHKKGEIMAFMNEGRMIIRPALHNNYSLSMPPIGKNGSAEPSMKQSRKGGPLKHTSRLKTGRNSQGFELGKTSMRNIRGRQVKVPYKAVKKLPKKSKIKEPLVPAFQTDEIEYDESEGEIIVYNPKKKKIPKTSTPKLKRSGRCPIARSHPKKR